MNGQFLSIAQDPQLIPGVHHHCDEWCGYAKIFRALVGAASDCAAGPRGEDARGCAKLAVVSIDRSRAALQMLRRTAGADLVDPLIAILVELDRGLEERFPKVRSFERVGLDCPVA